MPETRARRRHAAYCMTELGGSCSCGVASALAPLSVVDELHRHTEEMVRQRALAMARLRETRAKALITARFPRTGPWLVDHPRALALLFRLRPSLRPTLTIFTGTTAGHRPQRHHGDRPVTGDLANPADWLDDLTDVDGRPYEPTMWQRRYLATFPQPTPGQLLYERWCGSRTTDRARYYAQMNRADKAAWESLAEDMVEADPQAFERVVHNLPQRGNESRTRHDGAGERAEAHDHDPTGGS